MLSALIKNLIAPMKKAFITSATTQAKVILTQCLDALNGESQGHSIGDLIFRNVISFYEHSSWTSTQKHEIKITLAEDFEHECDKIINEYFNHNSEQAWCLGITTNDPAESERAIKEHMQLALSQPDSIHRLETICHKTIQRIISDRKKDELLLRALLKDEQQEVVPLVSGGADVNAKKDWEHLQEFSCLHIAAQMGSFTSVQRLLRFRADPNARDNYGRTPLQVTLFKNYEGTEEYRFAITKELLKYKADVNYSSTIWYDSAWKWIWAVSSFGFSVINSPFQGYHCGDTALHLAAANSQNPELIELLLQSADPSIKNKNGKTASQVASASLLSIQGLFPAPRENPPSSISLTNHMEPKGI